MMRLWNELRELPALIQRWSRARRASLKQYPEFLADCEAAGLRVDGRFQRLAKGSWEEMLRC